MAEANEKSTLLLSSSYATLNLKVLEGVDLHVEHGSKSWIQPPSAPAVVSSGDHPHPASKGGGAPVILIHYLPDNSSNSTSHSGPVWYTTSVGWNTTSTHGSYRRHHPSMLLPKGSWKLSAAEASNSSTVANKSITIKWQEEFEIDGIPAEPERMGQIVISCVDRLIKFSTTAPAKKLELENVDSVKDRVGFIGQTRIPISRLPEDNVTTEQWYQLYPKDSKSTRAILRLSLALKHITPDFAATVVTGTSPPEGLKIFIKPTLNRRSSQKVSSLDRPTSPLGRLRSSVSDSIVGNDDSVTDGESCMPVGLVDYVLVVGPSLVSHKKRYSEDEDNIIKDDFKATHDISVLYQYPSVASDSVNGEIPLPTKVEWFCFPGGVEVLYQDSRPSPKMYTFLLLGGEAGTTRSYGICFISYSNAKCDCGCETPPDKRRWVGTCVCFLTQYPLVAELSRALVELHSVWVSNSALVEPYIQQLTSVIPVPIPATLGVSFSIANESFTFKLPRINNIIMSCNDSDAIHTLFRQFSVRNVIKLLGLMWSESRILLHSSQLCMLGPVADALVVLMYPLAWHHPFVPILPRILSEYLQAPVPYILGVQTSWLPHIELPSSEGNSIVMVDIDRGSITDGLRNSPTLPASTTKALYERVQMILHPELNYLDSVDCKEDYENYTFMTETIAREVRVEFMCFLASNLNGYKDCLFFINEESPVFNRRRFLNTYCPTEAVPFMTAVLNSQAFDAFSREQSSARLSVFHSIYQIFRRGPEVSWPQVSPHLDKDFNVISRSPSRQSSFSESMDHLDFDDVDDGVPVFTVPPIESVLKEVVVQSSIKINYNNFSEIKGITYNEVSNDTGLSLEEMLDGRSDCELRAPMASPVSGGSSSRPQRSTEEMVAEEILQKCMAKLFSSDEIPTLERVACEECFSSFHARDLFVLILTQTSQFGSSASSFGSGSCLAEGAFEALVSLSNALLTQCAEKEDFANARGLLQVSSYYYRILPLEKEASSSGFAQKEYLQSLLRDQPICQSLDMWQYAFCSDIEALIKKQHSSRDGVSTQQINDNDFFSHMGALVYDMLNVNVDQEKVKTFVKAMCSMYNIQRELRKTLDKLVENVCRAIQMSAGPYVESSNSSPPSSPQAATRVLRSSSTISNVSNGNSNSEKYDLDTIIMRKMTLDDEIEEVLQHMNEGDSSNVGPSPPVCLPRSEDAMSNRVYSHSGVVLHLAAKNAYVVSGSSDGSVSVNHERYPSEQKILTGHHTPSTGVAFGPHSNIIVSSAYENDLRIWDLNAPIKKTMYAKWFAKNSAPQYSSTLLTGHLKPVLCMAVGKTLSSNNFVIVSGSLDKMIRIWHAADQGGHSKEVLIGHTNAVNCLKFGTQNSMLLSGSRDGTVQHWDMATCRSVNVFAEHTNYIRDIQISGNRVLTCSNDRTVKAWDIRTGKCTHNLLGHQGPVNCLVLGGPADPNVASASSDRTLRIWDLRNVRRGCRLNLADMHGGSVKCLQRDFSKVISGSADGAMRSFDLHTGKRFGVCWGHTGGVESMYMKEGVVLSGSWDGDVRSWSYTNML